MPSPNPKTIKHYESWKTVFRRASTASRESLYREMARRGLEDLHFFMAVILGCNVMTPPEGVHGRVCSFLDTDPAPRKWVEISRGHLKSTIVTEGKAIQEACRDENARILILSAASPLARSFLSKIKRKVEKRALIRKLYPHMVPDKRQWNEDKASIVRRGLGAEDVREATWTAAGLETSVTGGHFSLIIYDDLVTDENSQSREEQKKVINRFKALRPLLDQHNTPELMVGTPYKEYDFYSFLRREHPGMFKRLRIAARGEQGAPAWPEEFPDERLKEIERFDRPGYWAQYMLDPRPAELQEIKRGYFRWFRLMDEIMSGDWSQEQQDCQPLQPVDVKSLTCYLGVDPAAGVEGGDETAMCVVGVDAFGNYYVLDMVSEVMDFAAMFDWIFLLVKQWGVEWTTIEMAGPFATLEGQMEAEIERRGEWVNWEKASIGNQRKAQRVMMAIKSPYKSRKIIHHQSMRDGVFEEQLLGFPGGRHDDMCDALSHAIETARKWGFYGASGEPTEKREVAPQRTGEKQAMTLEQMQSYVPAGMMALAAGEVRHAQNAL